MYFECKKYQQGLLILGIFGKFPILRSLIINVNYNLTSTRPKPTYTVIAPAKLRPNSNYHVSVSMHHIPDHVDVEISISGPDQTTGLFNSINERMMVSRGQTRVMNFQIGEWGPGNYKLIVMGKGDLDFRNETRISYEQKSYSVFIQTDKAVYKPGQIVRLRAIIVNPSLVPTVTGAVDIYIKVSDWILLIGIY